VANFESPKISNFLGVDHLGSIFSAGLLRLSGYGESIIELSTGQTARIAGESIRDLGLVFQFGAIKSEILRALGECDIEPEYAKLVIIGEGSFLKNRVTLAEYLLDDAPEEVVLAQERRDRENAISDRRHGFNIAAHIVLGASLSPKPLRPRRKGTILARTVFKVRPSKISTGLTPRPLTEALIRQYELHKNSLIYVHPEQNLLADMPLDELVTIYIAEDVYQELGRLRSHEAKYLQANLAVDALRQLPFLVSRELANADAEEAKESTLIAFLHDTFESVPNAEKLEINGFIERLKSSPERISAVLSAKRNLKKTMMDLMMGESE
jgi:hypothetical protein